jgi:hypothetical protein
MSKLLRRPVLALALGAALATAVGAAGTAAYAALGDERVKACYAAKTGALYVIGRDGAPAKCLPGDVPIDWSVQGPQGPAGVFSGTFTSPNGAYSLSVTDAGIVLTAPGATARLVGSTVAIESAASTTVQTGSAFGLVAGTSLNLASGGSTTLQVGKDLAASVSGATSAATGKALSVAVGTDLSVATAGRTTVSGTGDVTIESQGKATLKGTQTLVQAAATNQLKGALVTANGSLLP